MWVDATDSVLVQFQFEQRVQFCEYVCVECSDSVVHKVQRFQIGTSIKNIQRERCYLISAQREAVKSARSIKHTP